MSRLPIIPKKHFDIKTKFVKGGKLTLSPFTVGIETLLLQVKDGDDKEKLSAVKQVLEECIQNKDIDVGKLPMFLVEESFLRLRQNSIGEIIEQSYQCTNDLEDGSICKNTMPIKIDLANFKLTESAEHSKTVTVSEPIGIVFKYPDLDMAESLEEVDDLNTIINCIESIYDADNVYPSEDSTKEELLEFWKQLTLPQKKLVYDKFFYSMPKFKHEQTLTCSKCGHVHTIKFDKIQDVFQ